jgi:hypothetical protein
MLCKRGLLTVKVGVGDGDMGALDLRCVREAYYLLRLVWVILTWVL